MISWDDFNADEKPTPKAPAAPSSAAIAGSSVAISFSPARSSSRLPASAFRVGAGVSKSVGGRSSLNGDGSDEASSAASTAGEFDLVTTLQQLLQQEFAVISLNLDDAIFHGTTSAAACL